MNCRIGLTLCVLGVAAPASSAPDQSSAAGFPRGQSRPVTLTIESPDAGVYRGPLALTRWPLTLRLEARHGLALLEASETDTRREAIVLHDPDGCIDMRHFPLEQPGLPYEDCAGPDERYVEFTTERFNSFDREDERAGNPILRAALIDQPFEPGQLLNKPYLRDDRGRIQPVPRPQTGEALLDGYGYGADDDLPGLVILADIGGARVFDENFDLVPGVVRNLAGFVNTVSVELRTRAGGPAVTATMHVLAGLFEPLALFDLDVDAQGADFLRRLESGPVEAFGFLGPPADDDALFRELMSTYSPVDLTLRAVLVEGAAPTFVHDANGDGRYTERDLALMGYVLLSNEERLRLRLEVDALITETSQGRTCPPRSLIFRDLDGNGSSGEIGCSGSGGAARLRRVPR